MKQNIPSDQKSLILYVGYYSTVRTFGGTRSKKRGKKKQREKNKTGVYFFVNPIPTLLSKSDENRP